MTTNEPAERLRNRLVYFLWNEADENGNHVNFDDRRDTVDRYEEAVRRATVDRIRRRLEAKWFEKHGHLTKAQWLAILDEEAAR